MVTYARPLARLSMTTYPPAFWIEPLEPRQLLSGVGGLTPQQVRHAYGFDQVGYRLHRRTIAADGSGQTIAIVDAFHAPTIQQDLKFFDKQFGLPDKDAGGKPVLSVAMPD